MNVTVAREAIELVCGMLVTEARSIAAEHKQHRPMQGSYAWALTHMYRFLRALDDGQVSVTVAPIGTDTARQEDLRWLDAVVEEEPT